MGFRHAEHQKERTVRLPVAEPVDALTGIQVCRIAGLHGQLVPISKQIIGITIGRRLKGVVTVEVIKPLVIWLRFVRCPQITIEMPFTDQCGLIAVILQQFGKGDFIVSKIDPTVFRDPATDTAAIGVTAR